MTSYRLRFWNVQLMDWLRLRLLVVVHDFLPFTVLKLPISCSSDVFRLQLSCMTSYRLRFWNFPYISLSMLRPMTRRAWLLTVYGFETFPGILPGRWLLTPRSCMTSYRLRFWNDKRLNTIVGSLGLSCMTSYRLRFWNLPLSCLWQLCNHVASRAWLLTVYGFETTLQICGSDFLLRLSCMTSYRLRFWNRAIGPSKEFKNNGRRAWLLTVYGFETGLEIHMALPGHFMVVHDFLPFTVLKPLSFR